MACPEAAAEPNGQEGFLQIRSKTAFCRLHAGVRLVTGPFPAFPKATPGWPDGGVVTQRTANPYTPVRFRLGPPLQPLRASESVP
jgi:hypothetical protein